MFFLFFLPFFSLDFLSFSFFAFLLFSFFLSLSFFVFCSSLELSSEVVQAAEESSSESFPSEDDLEEDRERPFDFRFFGERERSRPFTLFLRFLWSSECERFGERPRLSLPALLLSPWWW